MGQACCHTPDESTGNEIKTFSTQAENGPSSTYPNEETYQDDGPPNEATSKSKETKFVEPVKIEAEEPIKEVASRPGEKLVGEWITGKGKYTINFNDEGKLVFLETSSPPLELTGILIENGEWFEAPIVDRAKENAPFGFLRLQAKDDGVFSSFKKSEGSPWDPVGNLATKA
mmetsp:Transcript_88441/g.222599  ORF Transcript_88441/g.222599 Transcript_88441/m.222599 type:complete len:172 (-) Transcript_88441:174-689(-)